MAAQGRIGQDWGALGRLGKIPKRCKIGLVGSENHDESQPRDTVRLHPSHSQIQQRLRRGLPRATAIRLQGAGVLSEDQVK